MTDQFNMLYTFSSIIYSNCDINVVIRFPTIDLDKS